MQKMIQVTSDDIFDNWSSVRGLGEYISSHSCGKGTMNLFI